jgi:hypothetical protein
MRTAFRWLAAFGGIVCGPGYAAAQPPTPTVFVDCRVESLQRAIDLAPASAVLSLSGICERVTLRRNVTLSGDATASIRSFSPSDAAVTVPAGVRATLLALTLAGGSAGLLVEGEAALNGVRVESSASGIFVYRTGRLTAHLTELTRNSLGLEMVGGTATFRRSVIASNGGPVDRSCSTEYGGVKLYDASVLTLEDSSIRNNQSGGLCVVAATATLIRSSVTENVGPVGGIDVRSPSTLTVTQSSVTRNRSTNDGGGIRVRADFDGPNVVRITNSTIAFNTSAGKGGGLSVEPHSTPFSVNVLLTHTTVVGNDATGSAGIWTARQLRLSGSLVSGNRLTTTGADSDCGGPGEFYSQGWTLLSSPGSCWYTPGLGDLLGALPLLGTPATSGVTTYIPLLKTSPGRDAIPVEGPVGDRRCATAVKTDQRGVTRPVGTRCDIGSVEQ